jgi:hypothetical protein
MPKVDAFLNAHGVHFGILNKWILQPRIEAIQMYWIDILDFIDPEK